MHVAEAGPSDGQPIVLLHGWPQHWYEWRGLVPELGAPGAASRAPRRPAHASPAPVQRRPAPGDEGRAEGGRAGGFRGAPARAGPRPRQRELLPLLPVPRPALARPRPLAAVPAG